MLSGRAAQRLALVRTHTFRGSTHTVRAKLDTHAETPIPAGYRNTGHPVFDRANLIRWLANKTKKETKRNRNPCDGEEEKLRR